ncbi:AAA family ATPase [Nocardia jiangxiensis]|uniref:CpaE family protein n=1 Tax=Nocardia jiangxiensis TaxID=282685 RepID=A0ABW6S0T7_9NOCA|nr:MinD/ParA family protein [Nocardia jiangxiensis]
MNRAPSMNGHSTESVRARGGYDAFFAPVDEQAQPARKEIAAAEGTSASASVAPPTGGTPDFSAGRPEVPAPPREPDRSAQFEGSGSVTATPTPRPAATSSADDRYQNQTWSAQEPTPANTAPPAAAPPAQAATAAPRFDAAAGNSAAAWQSAKIPETSRAAEQPDAAPPTARVPDRVNYDTAARVEVLPAALTSVDLLADIAAARRAQLKSQSGMRGALNKVGFNLGLSPAEQRTENRRGRIRRQLTSTYQIAVISVKGGVGRTTVSAALGSTFASLRPDRVVGIDANPDFGDLPTRTCRHPYGLTLRDLAQARNLDAFSAVHSFTSINNSDLAVIASPWNTEATEALSGQEYTTAVEVLRRHYNLLIVDCGTGVLDSVTNAVLRTSDAVVVVTPATVGGVKGAVATLNWLNSHGLHQLIAKSIIAIVRHHAARPTVEVDEIEKLFASAQRPTRLVPYDEHLAEGGEIDLRLLESDTALAFEELAAAVADGFPSYPAASGDRGGWR